MRWDRNYSSSEVEDRRGDAPIAGGGGVPLWGILRLFSLFGWKGTAVGLVLAGALVVGSRIMGGGGGETRVGHAPISQSAQEDELAHFVGFVFDDVQTSWRAQMPGYRDAHLVLFRRATRSGCGTATMAVGPFYCPVDRKVYIDLSFYDELRRKLGAPGDFAQAYVIAHEVGHHVQNQLGLLRDQMNHSIEIELQADCLAGAWAKDAERRGELETGDLDEALNAATQIGDDTLQRREQGYVQPETWTHGSSAQRRGSFQRGYDGGPSACGVSLQPAR
ncbi:MAG TPA: neutral zinc metallopeptidase [Kofleriaceae bacterium]|nr:neutral zinc metallopeptidase [Kofleriaceae bacterium]